VAPEQLRASRLLEDPATREAGLQQLRALANFQNLPFIMSMLAQQGDLDTAVSLAGRMFGGATPTNRGFTTYIIARSTLLEPLRADPRFRQMLADMGIEGA